MCAARQDREKVAGGVIETSGVGLRLAERDGTLRTEGQTRNRYKILRQAIDPELLLQLPVRDVWSGSFGSGRGLRVAARHQEHRSDRQTPDGCH